MRRRFKPILRRLDRMWCDVYLSRIYHLLHETVEEKLPEIELRLRVLEAHEVEEDDEAEAKRKEENLTKYRSQIAAMHEVKPFLDEHMACISGAFEDTITRQPARTRPKPHDRFKKISNCMNPAQKHEYFYLRGEIDEIQQLYKDIEAYCNRLTVFGFNSAKFDINLIRSFMIPQVSRRHKKPYVKLGTKLRHAPAKHYINWRLKIRGSVKPIKRGKAYLSIQSSRLRFLDMSMFVAAGTSYDQWLKSRQVKCGKFHFPYEWFTDLDKLAEPLPPIEAFYSSLKRKGLNPEEYAEVQKMWREKGWTCMRQHLKYYNECDVVPFLEGVKSMRDFFRKEGKIDIIAGPCISLPGLADRMLKGSVPGPISFVLPQKTCRVDNSDFFATIKRGIVGGPAIVFRRHQEIGGRIRDPAHGRLCSKIVGYDANSLYLSATAKAQGCQTPVAWTRADDGTWSRKPFYKCKQSEMEWLAWEAHCRQKTIYHRFNGGIELFGCDIEKRKKGKQLDPEFSHRKDLRILGNSVDGYCPETKTVFFFDGCLWHQHEISKGNPCELAKRMPGLSAAKEGTRNEKRTRKLAANPDAPDEPKETDFERAQKIRAKDYAIRKQLEEGGYNVVVMPECRWIQHKKNKTITTTEYMRAESIPDNSAHPFADTRLHDFRRQFFTLPKHGPSPDLVHFAAQCRRGRRWDENFGKDTVLKRIWEETAAKRTPYIPPFWNDAELLDAVKEGKFFGVIECDLTMPDTPYMRRRFSEFAPIFKNVDIEFKDIGEHMQAYVREHGLEQTFPKRSLIGSTFCHQMPIITPLLRWYLKNGFECKPHKAWELKPYECFRKFADNVVEARRASDIDPDYGPTGEMFKLIGNSTYGKSITNIEHHELVNICDERWKDRLRRDPFFKTEEALEDNYYEIVMEKKRHQHNLNVLFGFFVYGYAKLRMIEFFHDFIDKFIPRNSYELAAFMRNGLHVSDSLYMAIAGDDLDSLVPVEFRDEYERVRGDFLPAREGPQSIIDKRRLGIFKLEYEGSAVVALNPKTYWIRAFLDGQKDKSSMKGLPKSQNEISFEAYKRVLDTKESFSGRLSTFQLRPGAADADGERRNELVRVDCERVGLSYLMVKRIVLEDGIRTKNIEL